VSGRIASQVYEYAPEDLTQAELTVLACLSLDAREADRMARYSDLESLVHLTRLRPGTIRNALSELTKRGLITPKLEHVHRGGKHQIYHVTKLQAHHRNVSLPGDVIHLDQRAERVTPQ
jgi:DNA-binding PadR family transcriptional regulator